MPRTKYKFANRLIAEAHYERCCRQLTRATVMAKEVALGNAVSMYFPLFAGRSLRVWCAGFQRQDPTTHAVMVIEDLMDNGTPRPSSTVYSVEEFGRMAYAASQQGDRGWSAAFLNAWNFVNEEYKKTNKQEIPTV